MGRDIKQREVMDAGQALLIQDVHDNPERTDRWIVETHVCFPDEASARKFFEMILEHIKPLPHHMRNGVRIDLRAIEDTDQGYQADILDDNGDKIGCLYAGPPIKYKR